MSDSCSDINNGGPAFPIPCSEMVIVGQSASETQGMTLRDYFAAKAMQAIIAKFPPTLDTRSDAAPALMATAGGAYDYADAMLAHREVKS